MRVARERAGRGERAVWPVCPGGDGWRGSRPGALARGGGKISDVERRAQRKIVTQKILEKLQCLLRFELFSCRLLRVLVNQIALQITTQSTLQITTHPHNPPCRLLRVRVNQIALQITTQSTLQITTHPHNPPCRLLQHHTIHLADYYTPHNPPCSLQITTHHRIHLADH